VLIDHGSAAHARAWAKQHGLDADAIELAGRDPERE